MNRLSQKVAVVTGASRGIGAAIAKAFALDGASVVVNYSASRSQAEEIVAGIRSRGGRAIAVGADVTKQSEAETLISEAMKAFGKVDILVNNSGVYDFAPVEAVTEEQYQKMFSVNVLGPIWVTQAAVKHMTAGASIINVSSFVSEITPAYSTVYTGTKGAIDAITQVWAREFGPRKIRVNAINPGLIETESSRSKGMVGGDMEKWLVSQTPLGRTGQVSDIAPIAVFLASDESGWLTGELLIASGGMR